MSLVFCFRAKRHHGLTPSSVIIQIQSAVPVPPLSLVHALHVLQHLSANEGRPVPVPEAKLLLRLTAAANLLPAPTLAHLPWAWGQLVQPDGYIPAPAQETLLHVLLGESAAAELVQTAERLPRGAAALRPPRRKSNRHTAPQKITAPRRALRPALPRTQPLAPPTAQLRCQF